MNVKTYVYNHRKVIGLLCAVISIVVAIVYLIIVPEEASNAHGVQRLVLTYGHSLCWVFLAGASALWALERSLRLSALLAYAGLAVYVAFMIALLAAKNELPR